MSGTEALQAITDKFNRQIYMSNNGQVDWAAVRHEYCAGDQTVASICRQHGISTTGLYQRRRQEKWPQRRQAPSATSGTPKEIHKSTIARLYKLLDRLLKEIEMEPMKAANDEGVTTSGTADRERKARTLSSLIRNFEKIKELETEELSKLQETDDDEINEADKKEAEALRTILQERFANLVQSGEI